MSDACRRHRCFCASDWLREDSTGNVNWLLWVAMAGQARSLAESMQAGLVKSKAIHDNVVFVLMLCRKIDNVPWQLKRPNMWGHDSWKRYHPFRPSSFIFIYCIDVY